MSFQQQDALYFSDGAAIEKRDDALRSAGWFKRRTYIEHRRMPSSNGDILRGHLGISYEASRQLAER